MSKTLRNLAVLATLASVPLATAFSADAPKAASILFEVPHIASVAPGTELVYRFERKPSDEKKLGLGFSDDIKVKIESDGAPGKKNVLVQIYSGERARDPQRITDMDGNPMVVVYLDNAVAHFQQLAGGDRAYLKNMFSKYIGEAAKVEQVTIDYKGDKLAGYKIVMTPYADDRARAKMRGYEGAQFTISVSEKIPGYLAKMVSNYTNSAKDGPRLEETMTLDGVGAIQ